MGIKSLTLLFICLAVTVYGRFRTDLFDARYQEMGAHPTADFNQTQYWFDQRLDHFNYKGQETWKQRYYVIETFFKPKKGPVILYICGEWVCKGITPSLGAVVELAQKTGALIVTLEHRYYGESMPFGSESLDLQNLSYLNTEQALKDLAYFIGWMNTGQHGIKNNPWVTIGGSYPGAMAAWFRYKYPHLTAGSLSSSGVVNAIEDFRDFDQQIYTATKTSSKQCASIIPQVNAYVEQQLNGNDSTAFKAQFRAENLTNTEFLWYWSDVIVFFVQTGRRTSLCDQLKNQSVENAFKLLRLAAFKVDPRDYSSYHLSDPEYYNADGQVSRSWNYQVCTEFGWFQTPSEKHPMRPKSISLEFYHDWCKKVYNTVPRVNESNSEFGGAKLTSVENLYMSNGVEDPWRWASVQKDQGNVVSTVIRCTNCSHCVDLYTPTPNDDKSLVKARENRLQLVHLWVRRHWRSQKSFPFNLLLAQE